LLEKWVVGGGGWRWMVYGWMNVCMP